MVILVPDREFKLRKMLPDGEFELRKILPDRVKIAAPQKHAPVHIRTKCLPRGACPAGQRFTVQQRDWA